MTNKNNRSVNLSNNTCQWITVWADICKDDAFELFKDAIDSIYEKGGMLKSVIIDGLSSIEILLFAISNNEELFLALIRFLMPYFLIAFPDLFDSKESFNSMYKIGTKNIKDFKDLLLKIIEDKRIEYLREFNEEVAEEEKDEAKQ